MEEVKRISILFLATGKPDDYKFSSKFRIYNYLPFLKGRNCRVKVISWNKEYKDLTSSIKVFSKNRLFRSDTVSKIGKILGLLIRIPFYNVVIIQRTRFPIILLRLMSFLNRNLVFDFDDALFSPCSGLEMPEWSEENAEQIQRRFFFMLPYFKLVIAGNSYLSQKVMPINSNVVVIPTPVDIERFTVREKVDYSTPYIIGWLGVGDQHLKHLQILLKPLRNLSKQHSIKLRIIGAMGSKKIRDMFSKDEPFISDISDFIPQDKLVDEIKTFTVGVMPLVDDEWSRGKCGYKALLYMACGIPTVASPVGINQDIIENGINGFLASSCEEWTRAIETIISMQDRGAWIGLMGRRTIETRYSQAVCEKKLFESITSLMRYN